ncbi:MAG: LysR family transcriptional regulator [Minwuia sp.]|nr:LysR family transcriptional regulator [Minwuia sp.]
MPTFAFLSNSFENRNHSGNEWSFIIAIDLRKLRHVVETARFENVTRAAEALYITQSALTRSLADVEAELGTPLFVRLPRGVRLTEQGRRFVDRARLIIGDMDDLLADIDDHNELQTGRLRLGVSPPGYQRYISGPIGDLASRHPGLRLEMTSGATDDLVPRLVSGDLDGIIGHRGWLKRWPDLQLEPLASFHSAFIVRRGHPLTQKAQVSERDILSLPMIIPASVEPLQTDLATLYTRNGLPPLNPHYVVDGLDIIQDIVDGTDACAPVTSLNPDFGRMRKRHHLFRHEVDMPVQRMVFATSQTRMVSPGAAMLAEILKDSFGHHSFNE